MPHLREYLQNYNVIDPYHDSYSEGELERMKNQIYQLQRCVEALVILLDKKTSISGDDFMNEV